MFEHRIAIELPGIFGPRLNAADDRGRRAWGWVEKY
jgi:hypothetical protein